MRKLFYRSWWIIMAIWLGCHGSETTVVQTQSCPHPGSTSIGEGNLCYCTDDQQRLVEPSVPHVSCGGCNPHGTLRHTFKGFDFSDACVCEDGTIINRVTAKCMDCPTDGCDSAECVPQGCPQRCSKAPCANGYCNAAGQCVTCQAEQGDCSGECGSCTGGEGTTQVCLRGACESLQRCCLPNGEWCVVEARVPAETGASCRCLSRPEAGQICS